ncbi:hypothetical protein AB834_04450 [PVC group bacterium (ex Bugula neritina AB1)]|nr:hypothetical protein AB834_04450 [PVC group bacterium (ex Bugula neritina AB1)]
MIFSQTFKKYICEKIEWIAFFLVFFLVALYCVNVAVSCLFFPSKVSEIDSVIRQIHVKAQNFTQLNDKSKDVDYVLQVAFLNPLSHYEELFVRDFCHPFQIKVAQKDFLKNPYVFLKIEKQEVPFVFKGTLIQKGKKDFYAQINSEKGTSFLRKGDTIMGYDILAISPSYIEIRYKGEDDLIRLDVGQVSLHGAVRAKIYNQRDANVFTVKEGDLVEGWRVVSIMEQEVVMTKGDGDIVVQKKESVL